MGSTVFFITAVLVLLPLLAVEVATAPSKNSHRSVGVWSGSLPYGRVKVDCRNSGVVFHDSPGLDVWLSCWKDGKLCPSCHGYEGLVIDRVGYLASSGMVILQPAGLRAGLTVHVLALESCETARLLNGIVVYSAGCSSGIPCWSTSEPSQDPKADILELSRKGQCDMKKMWDLEIPQDANSITSIVSGSIANSLDYLLWFPVVFLMVVCYYIWSWISRVYQVVKAPQFHDYFVVIEGVVIVLPTKKYIKLLVTGQVKDSFVTCEVRYHTADETNICYMIGGYVGSIVDDRNIESVAVYRVGAFYDYEVTFERPSA